MTAKRIWLVALAVVLLLPLGLMTVGAAPGERINVYFSRGDEILVAVSRTVPAGSDRATAALAELLRGPGTNSGLLSVMPRGTRVLSIRIDGGTAVVDLSSEVAKHHPGGSAAETMTVFALVNTLTEIAGIDRVQVLVEGKGMDTLAGHVDTSGPLVRGERFIER